MKRLRALLTRIASLFSTRRLDVELDEEIRAHLDLLADEHQRRGVSPADARAAALRDFGGVAQITESYRDQRGFAGLETVLQDLRYAVRLTRRAPGFSAVIVAVLTLGIGVNSAMFTFVNALLFRPLPGRGNDILGLYTHDTTSPNSYRNFSYPNYVDIRDRSDVFDQLIAYTPAAAYRPAGDVVQRLFLEIVSQNYFSAMGVSLAAGRVFTAEEARPGANIPVAIASYASWEKSGFDPSFIGSRTRLNLQDFTIVGIAPKRFTGTTALIAREYWVPLGMFDAIVHQPYRISGAGLADRATRSLRVAGWLKPGVTIAQANARLERLSADLEEIDPAINRHQLLTAHTMSRVNMSSSPTSDAGPAVLSAVAMPLSGAVLFIACLNVANMLLARSSARKKEIAIRLALGGGRARIVRQLLTESLLLAIAGAAGGLLVGAWTIRWFVASLKPIMPLPIYLEPRPDMNVLLVAAAFAALSALAFGLAPALRTTRPDVVDDLKDLGASRAPRKVFGTRAWLVVAQIAVSLMLITAGGLFARGALRANVADPGYSYDGLLLASLEPGLAGYGDAEARARVFDALGRVRRLPGVVSAGANSQVPFGDFHQSASVARIGQQPLGGREPTYTIVTTDYFKTVGLPVIRGRDFLEAEEAAGSARRVAIIDEPLAQRLFPGEDPLGQQIVMPPRDEASRTAENDPMTIVGIVRGIRDDLTERQPIAHLYVPAAAAYRGPMHIHARVAGNEREMLAAMRREIQAADPRLPVTDLRTMRDFHDRGLVLWVIRTAGRTLTGLGALALALAAIGVYGVKSYVVAQRTREIGIRLALGASPRDIVWMLLGDGARMTLVGLAIGFPLAVVLGRLLSVAMFEVSPYDPVVLTLAPSVLVAAAVIATYLPARRGMRVSPLQALRVE